MSIKVAINGFGRIGRQVTKAIINNYQDKLEVVVVNDLTDTKTNAYLFKHDSNYGDYSGKVDYTDNAVVIDGLQSALMR